MSNNREVLFLKEVNGVNEWFENGNEKTDAKYVGEIKKGVPNGTGTNTWPSGAMYKGNFKDGKYNGQGTYSWSDGRKYVGQHKDGKRHGQGVYTFPSGDKYIGKWKNGKQHGKGKETRFFGVDTTKSKWEDVCSIETVYDGEWKEGKIWNGEKYDKDRNVTSTFVNGEEKEISP